ncbi:hypothetical protein DFA_00063 [Cavenderia fasciculata]|uniref:EGF-like domain-containing protein n=1 Tax=Cavenderia fasciculata TaxID=261658 RepID=F4PXH6_CACFS|nr:uncharacterized protein DFA_00063 [Cavenderia fasciculata]EGG19486.1 hypothetical protein DFA_00063 [Cavenderia fasciculata]|eukprot:XP_004357780.1 hypothetical protein DFA_00063 [Cavenderia fasciculata]
MMKRYLLYLLLLIIAPLFFGGYDRHHHFAFAQTIPAEELNSAIWIIKQYRLDVPMDQTMCSSINFAVCKISIDGLYHLTSMYVYSYLENDNSFRYTGDTYLMTNGMPDTNLLAFTFPFLENLIIPTPSVIADPSLNMLNLIKNLTQLYSFVIQGVGDPSITTIPIGFMQQVPNILSFVCLCSITDIPQLGSNSKLQQLSIESKTNINFVIDESVSLPALLELSINYSPSSPQSHRITQASFPKITRLSFISDTSYKISIHHSTTKPNLEIFLGTLIFQPAVWFEFTTTNPSSIKSLAIHGKYSTYSPSDLENDYPNLEYLVLSHIQFLNQYPFSNFPPKLNSLNILNAGLKIIPSIPIPSRMNALGFYNNSLETVPWGIFSDLTSFNMRVHFDLNLNLGGSVPPMLCNKINYLSITNTALVWVPDCFWCYQSGHMSTQLPKPAGFTCPISLTTPATIKTIVGKTKIEGQNIGWGLVTPEYSLVHVIPNSNLLLQISQYANYLVEKPLAVSFLAGGSAEYNYTFNVQEVGILFNSAIFTFIQQPGAVTFIVGFRLYNPNIPHTATIDDTIDCVQDLGEDTKQFFTCYSVLVTKAYTMTISNAYTMSSFQFNYIQKYPVVSSGSVNNGTTGDSKLISLTGDFGNNGQNNASVFINGTIPCIVSFASRDIINCTISSLNSFGSASLMVSVDGALFNRPNMLYFAQPPNNNNNGGGGSLKEKCEKDTHNCYGNGQCQDNGQCLCNTNYNPTDNCLTQFFNETIPIEANQTAPTTRFEIDGVEFLFELYSIQELDVDGETVIHEVIVDNWNSTITTSTNTTTANYVLLSNETTAQVEADISFSATARQATFGETNFTINPNSIKVSVSINNWEYSSNIATLRVLFKTVLSNNQAVGVCGEQQSIDSLSYDFSGSTIQYLRVAKQGIQFTGRFLDYVVSDGRTTYSKTELVSLKSLNGSSSDQSVAMIGINFPQCQSCLLDPDFTPLIIDNSRITGCPSDSSNTWKIIVGACVGGVVFIALLVAIIFYLKDSNTFRLRIRNAKISLLLIVFNTSSSSVKAGDLPTDELQCKITKKLRYKRKMMVWIIRQYGLFSVPQNQTLCSYGVFGCMTDPETNLNHIQSIIQCPTVKFIPNDFPTGLPLLKSFDSLESPVTMAPTFFNNSNLEIINIGSSVFGSFRIDESLNLPLLYQLKFNVNSTISPSVTFTSKTFPKLLNLIIQSDTTKKITVFINTSPPQLLDVALIRKSNGTISQRQVNFDLRVLNPLSLARVALVGESSTITPFPLDSYKNLDSLSISYSTLTTYPFTIPSPNLLSLLLTESMFASIPNVRLPSSLLYLNFAGNNLNGGIPWDYFENINSPSINIENNPYVIGSVSEDVCHSKLNIKGTNLTSAPNCLWCYFDEGVLLTNLNPPSTMVCSPSVDNAEVFTIFGSAIITGSLLGYGNPSQPLYTLNAIIPNKMLKIQMKPPFSNYYTKTNMAILTSNMYSYSVPLAILEVGFNATTIDAVQVAHSVIFSFAFSAINPTIEYSADIGPTVICQNPQIDSVTGLLTCSTRGALPTGSYNISIFNEFYSSSIIYQYNQKYPVVNSAEINDFNSTKKVISLFGNFGSQVDVTIIFNNTVPCIPNHLFMSNINCTIDASSLGYGSASIFVSSDGANFTRSNMFYVQPPPSSNNGSTTTSSTSGGNSPTPKEKCQQTTHNCYGNGQCQDDGSCLCNTGYNQFDNCLTKPINNTVPIEFNTTAPVTRFEIDNIEFMFEMYSVQELTFDAVSQEVLTESWNSNITKQGDLTVANYTLISNDTSANITATISFSSQQRIISFGGKNLTIPPNAIKVAVSINNWQFQSNIGTLRVIFKTIVNNQQGISVGCDEQENVDLFAYDFSGNTIQYLRVLKEGIQFTGRFLDYVVSDGRSTYSTTELVSFQPRNNSADESIAMIGINMPQCQSCLLDPDFTPLIVDTSRAVGCQDVDSNIYNI